MRSHVYTFNHPTRHRWLRGVLWTGAAGAVVAASVAAWKFPSAVRIALMKVGFARSRTVESALQEFGPKAQAKFESKCRENRMNWPPSRVRILAFKEERKLEVWAAAKKGAFARLAAYPILAASGGPGPKRKEGDLQVPEGIYRLGELNPNSKFDLSVKVDYPNMDDVLHKVVEESKMGTDIMLHGGASSVGCIAIGDPAIEELWPLIAQLPESSREIWIAPADFRAKPERALHKEPWIDAMYKKLAARMREECPAK